MKIRKLINISFSDFLTDFNLLIFLGMKFSFLLKVHFFLYL